MNQFLLQKVCLEELHQLDDNEYAFVLLPIDKTSSHTKFFNTFLSG
jgi:hypothetical protein